MTIHSFDAAFREAKKIGAQFQLYEGAYELPASLPVGVVLEVTRLQIVEAEAKAAAERGEVYEGDEVNVVELFDRVFAGAKWKNPPEGWQPRPGLTKADGSYVPSALVQRWIDLGLTIDQMVQMLQWAFASYGTAKEGTDAPLARKTARGKVRA